MKVRINTWKKLLFGKITGTRAGEGVSGPREGSGPGGARVSARLGVGRLKTSLLRRVGDIVEKQGWNGKWRQKKRERIFFVF